MTQGELFEPAGPGQFGGFKVPECHANDPESSRDALAKHKASGRYDTNAAIMYRLCLIWPGFTAVELFEMACQSDQDKLRDFYEARRRLNSLLNEELVTQGPPRTCKMRGTSAVVWKVRPLEDLTPDKRFIAERLLAEES